MSRSMLMSAVEYPPPVFIGLCPKFRCARPHAWCVCPGTEHVVEICSVSHCLAGGPPLAVDAADLGNSPLYWTTDRGVAEWLLPQREWNFPESQGPAGPLCLYAYH